MNQLLFLGGLWHDMTKGPHQMFLTTAFFLTILALVMQARSISSRWRCVLLIVVAVCEVFSAIAPKGDATWMLSSFSDFGLSMLALVAAFCMMVAQVMLMRTTIDDLASEGGFVPQFHLGLRALIVWFVCAMIATLFGPGAVAVLMLGLVFYIVYTIVRTLNSVVRDKGSYLIFVSCTVLYILTLMSAIAMTSNFFLAGIAALIVYIFVSLKRDCTGCRVYDESGYCWLYQKHMPSSAAANCKRYQPRRFNDDQNAAMKK